MAITALTNDHYTSRPARMAYWSGDYRWFLRHFPRGGSYADIHHA